VVPIREKALLQAGLKTRECAKALTPRQLSLLRRYLGTRSHDHGHSSIIAGPIKYGRNYFCRQYKTHFAGVGQQEAE